MGSHGWHQSLPGYVLYVLLVLLVTGCGGGGGGSTSGGGSLACETSTSNELIHVDAGDIVAVRVNETAVLDGCGSSTTLNDPLSYAWSFSSKPDASNTQLRNATSVSPSFVGDVPGTYMVQLVVSAGGISSQRAIASVEVSVDGHLTGIRVHTNYSSQCSECHDGRFAVAVGPIDPILPKIGNHIASTNMCQACHTTFGFEQVRYVDHLEVYGNCSTCHDGVRAIGKSEFHVITNVECDSCHTTEGFFALEADGTYNHSGVVGGCEACHNGTTAIGKDADHFVTANDCSACHNTNDFKDAYVDHSNITDDCASCHDGANATGQTVGHPVMSVDCGICHSTTRFSLGGAFNHRVDASVQSCASCHNDNNSINARGKSALANHVVTSADCGICHGIGGGDFALGILDHSDPTVVAEACDSCHDGVTASGKSVTNHIPTILDCDACHTPGNFATGVFDHDPTVVDPVECSSCHDDTITAGAGVNHIPTVSDCRVCHTTDTFEGAVFDHGATVSGCATCHDGNISSGKSTNHMPTVQDCSDCHAASLATFTDFMGGTFDHVAGVNNNCASCHNGVIAIGKKVNHIPAQRECSQCHADTDDFKITTFIDEVHLGLSNGCEGCHTSRFFPATPAVLKAATHVPTNQDCHFCHTNDTFTFDPLNFTHAGITGNCESCHDGNYEVPANALGKTLDHPVTTDDCGVCHGVGDNFSDGVFDHTGRVDNCNECHADGAAGAVTKMNIGHVPTTQDCSICHVPGTFTTAVFNHNGIVDNCASCHDGTSATATVMSVNHLTTTEDCFVCHNTTAFAGARFDHQGVVDNCASCHDGDTALGKDGNHVPTNDDCSVCHQTTGFVPATFDHVGIVDNCQSCHDGNLAQGKLFDHVDTSQDCGACHTTRGFIPATFDHSGVSRNTRCDSCHIDGSTDATGMDDKANPNHIPTSLDCRSCHTTATFVGGTWTHDGSSAGVCKSCHNGTDATPQPSNGHISTNLECDECHSTNGWAPTSFSHDPQGDYPGDHRQNLRCGDCHGNVVTTPFVYPDDQYAPFCAACHRRDFESEGDHNGGKNGTVEQNKDCSGGGRGCHKVSDSGF